MYSIITKEKLLTKDHRHPKTRDMFDNILLPITICCMHTSMPPKRTSRRLRGYPPESQERVEIGSTDEEALPPQGASPPPGLTTFMGAQIHGIPSGCSF